MSEPLGQLLVMSQTRREWADRFGLGVLALLVLQNAAKGIAGSLGVFGWPWYELSYEHGFIRRGLVGTVFQALTSGVSIDDQRFQVVIVHALVTTSLLGFLAWWGWTEAARLCRPARIVFVTGVAAFFLSQLPPTLFMNGGYLDPWLLGATALGAHSATKKRFALAASMGVIGALTHDAAAFLWVSVIGVSTLQALREPADQRRWRGRLALLIPFLATGLVMAFHSPTAARQAVDAIHASDALKETLLAQQFGQALSSLIPAMVRRIIADWDHVSLAALLLWPPAAFCFVVTTKIASLRGWREISCAAVTSLAPCAVLLVAWDLSRFLLWGCFGSVLLLLSSASVHRRSETTPDVTLGRIYQAAFTALSIMSVGPFVYAYFEAESVAYLLGPRALLDSPGAYLTYWHVNLYNRPLASADYDLKTRCQPWTEHATKGNGCEWDLGENGFVELDAVWRIPGQHEAQLELNAICPSARVQVEIRRFQRYMSTARIDIDPSVGHVVVPFSVSWKEAALERFAVRASAPAGCVHLRDIRMR